MYVVAANPIESGGLIERRLLDVTAAVRSSVALPIAVKLSPFWSSLSHLAASLDGVGADGLVLFNRFYQPDIDVDDAGRRASSAPVRFLRAAAAHPLARGAGRPRPRIAGGERRRPRRRGRGQGADGRRRRRADRLRAARARARAPAGAARGARALDGGARVRVDRAAAGQHEPGAVSRPAGVRARQLHARAADVAARRGPDARAPSLEHSPDRQEGS